MSCRKIVPALIVISMGLSIAHAVDSDGFLTDARLEGILLPENFDYDSTANSGVGSLSINGSDDFDRPFRIGISGTSHQRGFEHGPIGLIGGGAVYYSRLPIDRNNVSERYEALSAQLRLGIGIYLGDVFHLEATPFVGIGGARGKINGAKSDTGLYWEYGIGAGAFASLGGSAQLGVIGGWLHGEYDLDFDENDNFSGFVNNVDVELTQEGFFIGISIGSRM